MRIVDMARSGAASPLLVRITAVAAVSSFFVATAAIGLDAAFESGDGFNPANEIEVVSGDSDIPRPLDVADGTAAGEQTVGGDDVDDTRTTTDPATTAPSVEGGGPSSPTTTSARESAPGGTIVGGRGVGPDSIRIGVEYTTEIDYSAFGASEDSASNSDQRGNAQAIVDYINAAGGIAGHRIEPVFHETDPTVGTFASQNQEACVHLAEDEGVFAALGTTNGLEDPACLAQHDVISLTHKRAFQDDAMFNQYPTHLFAPGRMSATRWAAALVDGLVPQGFFDGGTLGLVTFDSARYQRLMNEVVRPHLKAAGVEIAAEASIIDASGTADFGQLAAELANAILRFRASGVDRVLFIEAGGLLPFFWFPEAESQQYRPKYGLQSANIPIFHEPQAPAQLRGAKGVGWMPAEDVNFESDPGTVPRQSECTEVLKAAGYTFTDRVSFTAAIGYCDMLLLTKTVLETTSDWTPRGFREAVENLGTSHRSAHTFATKFEPGRHDGPSVVRDFAWSEECACFVYTNPPRHTD